MNTFRYRLTPPAEYVVETLRMFWGELKRAEEFSWLHGEGIFLSYGGHPIPAAEWNETMVSLQGNDPEFFSEAQAVGFVEVSRPGVKLHLYLGEYTFTPKTPNASTTAFRLGQLTIYAYDNEARKLQVTFEHSEVSSLITAATLRTKGEDSLNTADLFAERVMNGKRWTPSSETSIPLN